MGHGSQWVHGLLSAAGGLWMVGVASAQGGSPSQSTAPLPPDSQYVVVKDGHLSVNGERQRYWAAIGKLWIESGLTNTDTPEERTEKIKKSRAGTDELLRRFQDLGFNSFRHWVRFDVHGTTAETYTPGDGSGADSEDYFLAAAGRAGMRIWHAGLNSLGSVRPTDVDIVNDPATVDAWQKAISEMTKTDAQGKVNSPALRGTIARFWDPRLSELSLARQKKVATHLNKHNGLRWCDDPTFAVWELSNEEWWMRKMVGGQWQKLPVFFRNQLAEQWNAHLLKKYGNDDSLAKAWGKLLPGESVTAGSVALAPMAGPSKVAVTLNDANPAARQAVESVSDDALDRSDFEPARGADVLEFFMGMQLAQKKKEADQLKSLGKSTRLSPLIYDTGIGYEIQSQYLHQNADAVAHNAYVNGWGPRLEGEMAKVNAIPETDEFRRKRMTQDAERISVNTGPWVNWLRKPPGINQGVPWLEHNRVEGKPYLCYETQIQQPAKYRADFPLRLVALAGIQDWDWICWHYFASGDDVGSSDTPFDKPLDVTTGGHSQGYHFTYDQVQMSAMRTAASIFKTGLLTPAKNPTKFIFGRKSLYDPVSMDYAGSYGISGLDMLYTTYQHGVRIEIDPSREDDEVIGPVVKFDDRNTHNPYTPGEQITFDHHAGFLKIDAPGAVAFTGSAGPVDQSIRFEGANVTLKDVTIRNDPGMFDPVGDDERYIAFSLATDDGKTLAEARRVVLSLVSTSFNTDFKFNTDPLDGNWTATRGTLPVLTARVSATIVAPALTGMRYTMRDWHFKDIGSGVVNDGVLNVPMDKPIFIIELQRGE